MKEKNVISFVSTMLLLVVVLPADAVGVVKSASFEDSNSQTPSGKSAPQDYSISSVLPPTEWNKTYGGVDADRAYSVVETSDGGYALAGDTSSYSVGYNDFWLVRVDSYGNVQWNKTYGGVDADRAYSVVETSDGGYALAGYTASFGAGNYDFWLVKTDSSGNVQWNQTYGGANNDIAHSLIQTSDGGYALVGDSASYGAGGYDFWLVKTDSSGNVQWNQTYGGTNSDIAWSVAQTGDGGYTIIGDTKSYGAGYSDFWLVKTDSSGNVQWNQTYGGANNDIAHSLIQTSDGGYTITGDTKSYGAGGYDFWLIKTDSSGNVQWNQTYGGPSHDIAYSLVQRSDGGYALAGDSASYGAGGYDFWLVKTDSSGNVQWNQTYGGANNDIGRSVVQTSDGGYAIAGYTASYGVGGYDFWLVKVGAGVHDVAVTGVAPSKTVVGQNFTLSINVTVTNQGNYSETFNVTTYANETIIDTFINIILTNRNTATVTFTWNTTGVAYGNYTISAYAVPVTGEVDTADNMYTDGTVIVTIAGDVNGDRIVDIFDIGNISAHWYPGPPIGSLGYDANADVNNDGAVDIFDIGITSAHWGQSW